jgi:hypothetical protein
MSGSTYSTAESAKQPKVDVTESAPAFQFSVVECRPRFSINKIFKPNWEEVFPEVRPAKFLFRHRKLEFIEDFAKALVWLAPQTRMGIIPGRLIQGFTGWHRRTLDPFNKYNNPVTIEGNVPADVELRGAALLALSR